MDAPGGAGIRPADALAAESEPFVPDLTKWASWHPEDVAHRLAAVEAPWRIAAGWAIDLFLGGERREHEDTEIAVPHARFGEVAAALSDCDFFVAGHPPGFVSTASAEAREATHQTWARERSTGLWRLDVFREPWDGDEWVCRRDERIRLPYEEVVERTPEGIPYERPELVLLFKAKHARPKDEDDLEAVLPALGPERRRLLADWLALAHPGHAWLARLD